MAGLSTVDHLHDLDATATGLLFEDVNVGGHCPRTLEVGLSSFHIVRQDSSGRNMLGTIFVIVRRTDVVITVSTITGVTPRGIV